MSEIIVEKESVIDVFRKIKTIRVPKYQRSYSWEKNQCIDLWDDILINIFERRSEHFLGTLIFCETGEVSEKGTVLELVDGQQRLTSITILLAAMADALKNCDSEGARGEKRTIEKEIIKNSDFDGGANKLILGEVDEDFFKKNIQDIETRGSRKPNRKSEKRISAAYKFFQDKIEDLKDKQRISIEELIHRLLYGLQHISIIKVKVLSEVEAYTIFETINARGVDLAVADLLKNYIFSNSQTHREKIEQLWLGMQDALLQRNLEVSQYIRHYWISKYGKVREKDLYRQIKDRFQNRESEIVSFCKDLEKETRVYTEIVSYTGGDSEVQKEIGRYLNLIARLKLKQCYPLLLSVFALQIEERKVLDILVKIVKVAIQRGVTDKNPNEMEALYFSVAADLRQGILNLSEINNKIIALQISDEEFKDVFLGDQVSPSLGKILLEEMELSKSNFKPEKKIVNLTLEHILPQKRGSWAAFPDEDWSHFYERVGNYTLLGKEKNSMSSNDEYILKRGVYRESDFAITRSISEKYKTWGKSEIDARGLEIYNFLCQNIFKE